MKVLHIGKYYPPFFGGIEKVNFDLVESLNEAGFSADVLCFNHQTEKIENEFNYNVIRASTLTSAFSSPLSLSIFKILRNIHNSYNIIHLHLPNPMGAVALQSVPFKGKIIVHWHSDIVKQKLLKKFYYPLQTKLLKRADSIIVTTPNYLNGSNDLLPYRNKCTIIPIGISKDEFKRNDAFKNELQTKFKNKKIVFSIGRLIYYKGFEFLIEAAKKISDDFVILIGGVGTLHEKLNAQIIKNNLQQKVILLGKIPFSNLAEYYRHADIFCLPSIEKSEAFGVVLIEAMSFGCPIISTNIPGSGVSWVNQNNTTGLVVEPKNSDALAEAIEKIGNNPEKQMEYSKNSISRYEEVFTKNKMVMKTIELYQNVLNPV